jgi:hypothetical protein
MGERAQPWRRLHQLADKTTPELKILAHPAAPAHGALIGAAVEQAAMNAEWTGGSRAKEGLDPCPASNRRQGQAMNRRDLKHDLPPPFMTVIAGLCQQPLEDRAELPTLSRW